MRWELGGRNARRGRPSLASQRRSRDRSRNRASRSEGLARRLPAAPHASELVRHRVAVTWRPGKRPPARNDKFIAAPGLRREVVRNDVPQGDHHAHRRSNDLEHPARSQALMGRRLPPRERLGGSAQGSNLPRPGHPRPPSVLKTEGCASMPSASGADSSRIFCGHDRSRPASPVAGRYRVLASRSRRPAAWRRCRQRRGSFLSTRAGRCAGRVSTGPPRTTDSG